MARVLGVDGGGTKTDLVVEADGVRRSLRIGGTSLARRPAEEVFAELERACVALETEAVEAVCAGFASAGRFADDYHAMLKTMCPRANVVVLTDAEIAWRGAFGGEDGIVVIAGTGSIAWGRYQGRTARAGGMQPGSDPGSGDWIAATGAGPEATAGELARLLEACAGQLKWKKAVGAAVGGVFEHHAGVLEALRRAWPGELRTPQAGPIEGALQLARGLARC